MMSIPTVSYFSEHFSRRPSAYAYHYGRMERLPRRLCRRPSAHRPHQGQASAVTIGRLPINLASEACCDVMRIWRLDASAWERWQRAGEKTRGDIGLTVSPSTRKDRGPTASPGAECRKLTPLHQPLANRLSKNRV
jgi:hypothetical protein